MKRKKKLKQKINANDVEKETTIETPEEFILLYLIIAYVASSLGYLLPVI